MNRLENIGPYHSPNKKGGLNKVVAGVVLATAIVTAGILVKNNHSGDFDLKFSEEVTSKSNTPDSKIVSPKSLSQEILAEYERRKNEDKVKNIQKEIKDWIDTLLSKLGLSEKDKLEKKAKIDLYLLSKISKEYLDEHKVSIVGNNAGKAFLITYHQKIDGSSGKIVYLPIPPKNPNSVSIKVTKGGIDFSLSPTPKSNGYNTEYNISSSDGGSNYQLSILYPYENSKYSNYSQKISSLKSKKEDLLKKESDLKASEKGKKKKDIAKYRLLQEQYSEVMAIIKELEQKLSVTKKYDYFSYIPYTRLQDNPETQKIGFSYLLKTMDSAYNSIFQKKVSSYPSAVPGFSIGEAIPESFPLVLNIIERMDYIEYFEKDGITLKDKKIIKEIMISQINRALTTFGLNGNDSFNWQKSEDKAVGIGQILPGTYDLFKKHEKYKSLFPEEEFSKAAIDHKTSFRLQIAHFDDQIYQLPRIIRGNWSSLLKDNESRIGLNSILAAGYNGGMKRIVTEVFGTMPEGSKVEDYKNVLVPKVIMSKMKIARDLKIAKLENEIFILRESLNKEGIKKPQNDLITAKIKEKQDLIVSANNTYKESVTYVLKTEFVINYLLEKYREEMSQI
ncbi:MAG: hypothetical protein PHI37_01815 [Candidatus Gracilibacteria bacterium]|nr:hypothetical protein [Candidatus Gracilibacteria bacterium]